MAYHVKNHAYSAKKINIQFIYKNILNTYSLSYFVLCETFCNFAPEKQIL